MAREDWLDERSEEDLSTTMTVLVRSRDLLQVSESSLPKLGKSHPEDKDKLESIVECYA